MIKRLILVVTLFLLAMLSHAAPVDLSSWTQLTLDFPGSQGAGNWVLEAGNESVVQQINADPSLFLNNLDQTSTTVDGSWEVLTRSDDDYMGFVFGYQNSSNFYLFDWKQGTQGFVGTTANEGMTIKKMTGATGDGLVDLSIAEFWENGVDFGDMDVLAQNHSSTAGWADNTLYDFHLDFNNNPGEIAITVKDNLTSAMLWDVTVNDTTFSSGQFGFFNNSQGNVRYAGFEIEGIPPTDPPQPSTGLPEPGTLGLLVTGLLGGIAARRRRRTG